MPVPGLIQDSFFGELVYRLSGRRWFRHVEEMPGFQIPKAFDQQPYGKTDRSRSSSRSNSVTVVDRPPDEESGLSRGGAAQRPRQTLGPSASYAGDQMRASDDRPAEKGLHTVNEETDIEAEVADSLIVDWYGPDDPENPMNWSLTKRCFVTFEICLLTFSIYVGAALFSPGIGSLAVDFGISPVAATLGLTMFILGYGVGPMFLSPLSEIPQFGRTNVYILSLALFVVLQVPTALCKNLGALLPLRFLAGFAGSPALATGGATLSDVWGPGYLSIVIGLWGLAATCGPVLGPVIGGFVAQAKGWTWTIWVLLWLSGGTLAFLVFFFPETSHATILHRRAARLRRLTGNPKLRSRGEIESQHLDVRDLAMTTLVRPFILGFVEPIVIFWNIYVALIYGIIYIWISSFDVVFIEHHGFNLGQNGLAFLAAIVGSCLAYACFVPYVLYILKPKIDAGTFVPEDRLPLAMIGSFLFSGGLFWFGWTSGSNIHWSVPVVASMFNIAGAFLVFQAGINYLADCYPRYVASLFAGNDFVRASFGAGFPLFSTAFFHNLGVGPACSVMGGLTVLMIPVPFLLYRYGHRVRAWSKYAD